MLVEETVENVGSDLKTEATEVKVKKSRHRRPYPQVERDIHLKIAGRVQDVLERQGVSVRELSERLGEGVSLPSLKLALAGKSHFTAARIKRIADALGINPVTFFLFTVEEDEAPISEESVEDPVTDSNVASEEEFSAIL